MVSGQQWKLSVGGRSTWTRKQGVEVLGSQKDVCEKLTGGRDDGIETGQTLARGVAVQRSVGNASVN